MKKIEKKSKEEFQKNKQSKINPQDNQEYKKIILELINIPIFLKDNDHRIIFANHAFFNLFGLDENSVIGKTLAENVPENERQHFLKIDRSVLDTGAPDFREEELTIRGFTHTIITKKSRFVDESGNKFLVGSINDISERKQFEKELLIAKEKIEESEDKYRFLFESNPMPMSIFDSETLNFLSVNNAFIDKYGYSKEEFLNMTILKIRPDSEKDKLMKSVKLKDKGVTNAGVFIHKKKNGELIQVEIIRQEFILEGKNVKLVLVNDITNQKQFENERNLAHQRFINTLENMTDGFVSLDKEWNYTYVNKIAGTMFGRKPEDLIGKHIWTEFPEGINQPFYKNYYKAAETQTAINFEDYYQPWDKWFENRVIPSKDGLSIFFHDITGRKKAELELKKQQEQLEELIKERTKEIENKNKKLEKLNSIFIGRELRMKELKNQIAELKKNK